MKDELKIFSFTVSATLSFWLLDAVVDKFTHYDEPFLHILLFDEHEVHFRLLVTAFFLAFGFVVARFFSFRTRMYNKIQESENRYRSLVESTDNSIYLIDRDYRYIFMNRKHLARLGLSEDSYVGMLYGEIHTPEEAEVFRGKIDACFTTAEPASYEYRSSRDNRYFLQTVSPVKNKEGRVIAVTIVSKDITERKKLEEKLHSLSFTDELTGLYNRRGFFVLAEQQLKLAERDKRRRFLISADLDSLKVINDNLGHNAGDSALVETARILVETFRDSDIIARVGGDEFVLLGTVTPETDMDTIGSRLRDTLEKHNAIANRPFEISLSIGVATYDPAHPCSMEELLSSADKLMYAEKRNR